MPASYFDKYQFEITGPGKHQTIQKIKKLINENSLNGKVNYNEPIYDDEKINYLKKHDVLHCHLMKREILLHSKRH